MNEEREMVLRMLKEGKVSVEEADALLQALSEETAAERPTHPEEETPQMGHPGTDIPDIAGELRGIFQELRESIPGEVLRGLRQSKPWRAGFRHVIRGLRGLEEGWAESTATARMAPGEVVAVQNAWGDVRLVGSAGPDLRVVARKRVWSVTAEEARRLAETLDIGPHREGARILVGAPMAAETRRRVDLEIEVPAGVAVSLDIAKGDVRSEGLRGGLEARIARGDVHILSQDGPLDLAVASGDIVFRRIEGDVRLDVKSGDIAGSEVRGQVSGRILNGDVSLKGGGAVSIDVLNGDVSVGDIAGNVDVEAKNGDVELGGAQGSSVRLRTLSGDVGVAGWPVPKGGVLNAETMSGDIDVALPPEARATLDAATMSGEVSCSLPLQDRATDQGTLRRRILRGVLNGPDATITLRTTRGDISIRGAKG